MSARALSLADSPVAETADQPVIGSPDRTVPETSPSQIVALVLWVGCLSVGVFGLVWTYPRPAAPAKIPPPVVAEVLQVQLTNDPLPPSDISPAGASTPPPLLPMPAAPSAPALAAVAEPSAAVAFALPVEGPSRVVPLAEAGHSGSSAPAESAVLSAATGVQSLTYGQGEGRQPAPRYPVRARNAGQEGTVVVRFSVGENGRVLDATAATPSPWPLLNDEAVRTVRELWRFRPGAVRLCEVAIHFSLRK
jgi:protein TonB